MGAHWKSIAALPGFGAALLFAAMLGGCSFKPEGKPTVEDGDFIEPVASRESSEIWKEIAALRDLIDREPRNAELHRQLCVLYRLIGTPRSRMLSSEEIDKAIALEQTNPVLYVEQGLTLVARRFVGDAEASFTRATQLDAGCFDAWFQLGRMEQYEYFKTMCFSEHLAKSIEFFEKAYQLSRKDEETLVNLAFLSSFRQMYQTGLKYGLRAVMLHPRSQKAHLVCGMLFTRHKNLEKAEKEFSTAFLLMSEEDCKPYDDISPLLSFDERELYLSSSSTKRQEWNRRFWAECDPTPATEINERRLEHFARVVIADLALSDERRDAKGTETDRAAALIRFGLPDKKLYDLSGGTSGGWIVWQYKVPTGSFNLYFNDEFLNGDYHFPISDSYGEVSRNLVNSVPQRYEYPIKYAQFPISVEIAERQGAEDRTRLELSVAIPDSIKRSKSPSWDLYVTFFDSEWNRFSRERIPFKPDSLPVIEKGSGRFLVCNFCLEMLPRALTCTCVVELTLDKDLRKAVRKSSLDIRDMHGTSLKLSDIKLAIPDSPYTCSTVLDPITLYREKGRLCLSYEAYNLRLDENGESHYRLTYSIRSPESGNEQPGVGLKKTLSHMWSSVRIDKPGGKPYVESNMEQRARSNVVSDALQIDIETLQAGTYMLCISVEDLATGAVVSESRLFTVSE